MASLSRSVFLLTIALVFVLLAAACGGGDDDETPATPTSDSSGQAADVAPTTPPSPTAAATPTEEAPTLEESEYEDVPRSVSYADFTFTLTKLVTTNQSLRSYATGGDPVIEEDVHVIAHITARNDLNGRVQHFDKFKFSLEIDGATIDAVDVPGQPVRTAQAASSTDVLMAFPAEDGIDLASGSLIIAEPGTIPAIMPLSGAVPESDYPFAIEIEEGEFQVTSGNPCGTTMLTSSLGAEVDLDAKIDGTGSASAIEGTRRAAEGERFVRVEMRATGDSGECGGANLGDDLYRLQIDGVPRGAINNVNEVVRPGEAIDFTLLYRVPEDASELILLAGEPDGLVAQFALTFALPEP